MNDMTSGKGIGRIAKTKARNRMYALLAMGFRYPEAHCFEQMADGSYADAIVAALDGCNTTLAEDVRVALAPDLRTTMSLQEFESGYLSAFETNMPEPSVSLYEGSHHMHGNKPGLLLELKGFYQTFGLTMADADNDLEDALAAELEFMQFLTAKQAQAEEGVLDRSPYLRAQRDFVQRHLEVWLPSLLVAAKTNVKQPFYLALIALATDFVAADAKILGRDVARLDVNESV